MATVPSVQRHASFLQTGEWFVQFVVVVGVSPNFSCLLSMQMHWHEWSKFWKMVDVAMKDAVIVCGMITYSDSSVGKSLDEYVGFNACQEDCVLAPIVCRSCQWLETLQQNAKSDFRCTAIEFTLPEPWLIVVQLLWSEYGLPAQHGLRVLVLVPPLKVSTRDSCLPTHGSA